MGRCREATCGEPGSCSCLPQPAPQQSSSSTSCIARTLEVSQSTMQNGVHHGALVCDTTVGNGFRAVGHGVGKVIGCVDWLFGDNSCMPYFSDAIENHVDRQNRWNEEYTKFAPKTFFLATGCPQISTNFAACFSWVLDSTLGTGARITGGAIGGVVGAVGAVCKCCGCVPCRDSSYQDVDASRPVGRNAMR